MLKQSVSYEAIEKEMRENTRQIYPSRFMFLNSTRGIRPRMLSGIMGTTGSGKSTLTKTMIVDAAKKEKVMVWLSEETVTEYQIGMHKVSDSRDSFKNICFVEEKNLDAFYLNDHETFLEYFKDLVVESGASLIFIDNLTSSNLYSDDIGPSGQSKTAVFLSKITKDLGVGIFFVAHTSKKIVDNQPMLITKEDIRGSQKITILAEYFYIIQKFTAKEKIYPLLNIVKHRHHNITNKFFLLGYKKDSYEFDQQIDFSLVNKIFKNRDRLGG